MLAAALAMSTQNKGKFYTYVKSLKYAILNCFYIFNISSTKNSKTKSETKNILIISGGDGYEDFRNSGANSLSEIAGREDSTNHLLIWQI